MKNIHIISGGTRTYIDAHFAWEAPGDGDTGHVLGELCAEIWPEVQTTVHFTRLAKNVPYAFPRRHYRASIAHPDTPTDVKALLDQLVEDKSTLAIFMPVSLIDFRPTKVDALYENSKAVSMQRDDFEKRGRISTRGLQGMLLMAEASEKLIPQVRAKRKDIKLIGFKQTDGLEEQAQYIEGLHLLKGASCNFVLANDRTTQRHMVITPEEARYHVTTDREAALRGLVEMVKERAHLRFTRSTIVDGKRVPWDDPRVPEALRKIVEHCIQRGAYKPFRGKTAGHFAVKLSDTEFLTSVRKTDFNTDLIENGLVYVRTDGPDTVMAYGARPSVGGQSQRIVFRDHPGMDCIVHFHCPRKEGSRVPVASQREFECGSHECGANTSNHLLAFDLMLGGGQVKAVMLDQHGPNIVFSKHVDPNEVIDFIEDNFDLTAKTGGPVEV